MSQYQWLLFLHVTGAFFLGGGVVVAVVLGQIARMRERPSEVAAALGLVRFAVPFIAVGALFTIVFGLWLVRAAHRGYGFDQPWVILAVIFWIIGNGLGSMAGKGENTTLERAKELAAAGDQPTTELRAHLNAPRHLLYNYGGASMILAVLIVMVWKPGA